MANWLALDIPDTKARRLAWNSYCPARKWAA